MSKPSLNLALHCLLVAGLAEGTGNILGGGCCAHNYNESHDYFPDKVNVNYQTGFTVDYYPSFKLVSIVSTEEEYVLYQRGTPQPWVPSLMSGKPDLVFIPVPIERAAVLANSYFAYFELLGERRSMLVTTVHNYINDPCLQRMVAEDGVLDAVTDRDLANNNVFEQNNIDVIFRWSGSRDDPLNNQATSPDLPPVVRVDTGGETHPMMMMEWIEYVALFYNREKQASDIVQDMKARYDCIVSYVRQEPEVRVLFASFSYSSSSGYVKCSFSIRPWQEHMINDLGGTVIGAYPGYDSSGPCNFTAFKEHADTADVWLYRANNFQEGRYGSTWSVMWNISHEVEDITPLRTGRTFDPNGNHFRDFWASRMVELDVELEDLVVILHPGLKYDHQRVWWLNVRTETDPGLPAASECTCKYGAQSLKANACPSNYMTAPQANPNPESDYGCDGELVATMCGAHPLAITCGADPTTTRTTRTTTTLSNEPQLPSLATESSDDEDDLMAMGLGLGFGLGLPLLLVSGLLFFLMVKCDWKPIHRQLQEIGGAPGHVIGSPPATA